MTDKKFYDFYESMLSIIDDFKLDSLPISQKEKILKSFELAAEYLNAYQTPSNRIRVGTLLAGISDGGIDYHYTLFGRIIGTTPSGRWRVQIIGQQQDSRYSKCVVPDESIKNDIIVVSSRGQRALISKDGNADIQWGQYDSKQLYS